MPHNFQKCWVPHKNRVGLIEKAATCDSISQGTKSSQHAQAVRIVLVVASGVCNVAARNRPSEGSVGTINVRYRDRSDGVWKVNKYG